MTTEEETNINSNTDALVELYRQMERQERCSQVWFQILWATGILMQSIIDAFGVDTLRQVLRRTSSFVGEENMILTSPIQDILEPKRKRGRPKKMPTKP